MLVVVKRMQPADANVAGDVFGGTILELCDEAAATAAMRHVGGRVVTAGVDDVEFRAPAHVGELLRIDAELVETGETSMRIAVRVEAEDVQAGDVRHTNSACFTMVALDEDGRPTPVPPLAATAGGSREEGADRRG